LGGIINQHLFDGTDATCNAGSGDSETCNDIDACTWCWSEATVDRCTRVTLAENLPSNLFKCDKVEEKKHMTGVSPSTSSLCGGYTDNALCNADDKCSWCKGSSTNAEDECVTIEAASKLNPSILKCEKVDE